MKTATSPIMTASEVREKVDIMALENPCSDVGVHSVWSTTSKLEDLKEICSLGRNPVSEIEVQCKECGEHTQPIAIRDGVCIDCISETLKEVENLINQYK